MNVDRRLPAEYEAQQALWLIWPTSCSATGETWGENDWSAVQQSFIQLVSVLQGRVPLHIICHDAGLRAQLVPVLLAAGLADGSFLLHLCPYDDLWLRDSGPISVIDAGKPALVAGRFDGWGGRHPARRDAQLTARLYRQGAFPGQGLHRVERVLEGGGIDSDGQGTLISTSSWLARCFAGLSAGEQQAWFARYFGCRRLLVLSEGRLHGDDTDGHIDMLVRFVGPELLLYTACDDPAHPDYAVLRDMVEELRGWRQENGLAYRLVPLPVPSWQEHDPAPRNYANFLISNGCVLFPCYGHPRADDHARGVLQACFAGYRVEGIDCSALIRQGGGLHCVGLPLFASAEH